MAAVEPGAAASATHAVVQVTLDRRLGNTIFWHDNACQEVGDRPGRYRWKKECSTMENRHTKPGTWFYSTYAFFAMPCKATIKQRSCNHRPPLLPSFFIPSITSLLIMSSQAYSIFKRKGSKGWHVFDGHVDTVAQARMYGQLCYTLGSEPPRSRSPPP
ncbi:hypothetical protein DL89DRAFT_93371 [Linderina pennispora]|uniref:Uncharacterized protein n=1 Tax=Linderina pennispora TaxID=61395 RepID=A0A1Y1VQ98_9FUNG|nr:uncharacterized protein DL89DRAFT_93371 [Linderina pennispora]ORX63457.1 hypothetical protein DL89DRAFT_93371 [Linderina pennispora]